ncbi:MAG: metallophosphoesterase family protein, partial [candidate division WOR-3 bacterium]
MKVGVTSDTHKYLKNFIRAIDSLRRHGVDLIIHLGDDYTDCDEIGEEDIVRVPGVYSEQYQDPGIPNRQV